ncbi:hypothetical protein GCM10025875_13260 [Litorihabitans aurantiacus]|uniref:4'-phosphopantetheinyl transferase domain-containing protein n=2 Tax=Litorihabitans aurantiacus TaxID=1930061 RepID=A0AA37XBN5_9MICO|nr:hypothetical protein GCM10025875_13260 [Litorihabitans aurantiacus]
MVDDVDRVAAARRRRPDDARRTLAGRAALRLLVLTRTGRPLADAPELVIERRCEDCDSPHGRPRTAGLSLSTSGSGERVLVAVGPEEACVGVDVETATPAALERSPGLDEFTLHPRERDAVARAADPGRARLQRWVEKEAVLKAAGLGLRLPPHEVLLAPADATTSSHHRSDGQLSWRAVLAAPVAAVARLSVADLPGDGTHHRAVAAVRPHPVEIVGPGALGS